MFHLHDLVTRSARSSLRSLRHSSVKASLQKNVVCVYSHSERRMQALLIPRLSFRRSMFIAVAQQWAIMLSPYKISHYALNGEIWVAQRHLALTQVSQRDLKAVFLVFNVSPGFVSTHQALFLDVDAVVEALVLPAEEGREGDDDGGQPDQQDHRPHRAEGPRVDVLHLRHRPIPEAREKNISRSIRSSLTLVP